LGLQLVLLLRVLGLLLCELRLLPGKLCLLLGEPFCLICLH